MSGIAGIFNRDGRDVDPDLLARMTNAIAYRGPDGTGKWIGSRIGFGHQMLATTPESLHENQPLCDDTGNLCLTFDGRIDNQKELKASLKTQGIALRTNTDAEMVLAAYTCWGTACPSRILGDFAFAIWDSRKQQLFCARDILGIRPFYYYTDTRTFLFASELQQLLKIPSVPREPNEGMIGEYLVSAVSNKKETLYKGIFRLPPAHFLIITEHRVHMERYWDIDPSQQIRYRSDEEYAAHFLDIFKKAVHCRMRTHGRVGAQLSGGLDSSSVSCVAQSLINTGAVSKNGFETFSLVFPGWGCDESEYIEAVKQKWNIKSNPMPLAVRKRSWYEAQVDRYLDIPDYPNGSMSDAMEELAREKGFRVMLTGLGGDEWFTGNEYRYADLLKQLKIQTFIRHARQDRDVTSLLPIPSNPLWRWALKPFIPVAVQRGLRRLKNGRNRFTWINPAFSRSIGLPNRLRKDIDWHTFSSFAQAAHYTNSTSGFQTHAIEMEERSASSFGIELRHPFHDRRLLEFGMALPEAQRFRNNQKKFVLRRAMGHYLPESVLRRYDKAEFSQIFIEAFQSQGGEFLTDSLTIADMGWVDGNEIRRMYQQIKKPDRKNDEEYHKDVWSLWHVFGIELWFNAVFNQGNLSKTSTGQK